MKKITTIFIITLCLLSFTGPSCLAQESYGGRIFIVGIYGKCIFKTYSFNVKEVLL